MANFRINLRLKKTLVATFNKTFTVTSVKQRAEQGMNVPVHHKHLKVFGRTAPFSL